MNIKDIIRRIIKKVWGVDGTTLFIKKQKKALLKKIYTKKYSADDLVSEMVKMGMKEGDVVFIHSSMTEFYNFTGSAVELIDKIISVLGEKGTLMMPAYPHNKFKLLHGSDIEGDTVAFDVNKTPSGAGYLSEIFRTYPGVKRSANLQHSVCAYGKLADFFVEEHHLSVTAWDEFSPYFKMSKMETKIFALGLPYFLGTMIHCTESILKDKYQYFSSFFEKAETYKYRDANGDICTHTTLTHDFTTKRSKKKIIKNYFDKKEFHVSKVSNLRIEFVYAKYTLDLYLHLASKGITMYSKPSPKKFISNGKFILKK